MIRGGRGREVEKCPKFPLHPLIDIYGPIVKRLPFDNYASTCRSTTRAVLQCRKSPLDGSSRGGVARLRPSPLLLTPWQWGLVKRMFHGKKISPLVNYSRLHPSTTLTEREGDTTNGMETQRQRVEEGEEERREEGRREQCDPFLGRAKRKDVENVFKIPPWKRSFGRSIGRIQSFYVLQFAGTRINRIVTRFDVVIDPFAILPTIHKRY